MNILDAARAFDDCHVLDTSGAYLFNAQLDIYDKSTSEGMSSSRRTLNSAPGELSIPTNKLITIDAKTYVAGRVVQDSFQGSPIRDSLVLQETNSMSEVYDVVDLISSSAPLVSSRSFLSWRKTQKEEERTAQYFNLYDIYLPEDSDVSIGQVSAVTLDSESFVEYYFVSALERSSAGFLRVVTYQLGVEALLSVSYFRATGVYDPASGEEGFSTPVSLTMLAMRYMVGYDLESYSSKKFEVGDFIFLTSDSSAISGDYLESAGKRFDVISVYDEPFGVTGLRSIHGRRT